MVEDLKIKNILQINLYRNDRLLSKAFRRRDIRLYEELIDHRNEMIADGMGYRAMDGREWHELLAWCDRNKIY